MAKTLYPYLEDERLIQEVSSVFTKINSALKNIDSNFHSNVIDPFSAIFDAAGNNILYPEWSKREKDRQLQKTMQNEVGYFHQRILGSIGEWKDPGIGAGYDSENKRRKIFAELKNKWNTFNSASATETYNKMSRFLDTDKRGYTGYVVFIIPKTTKRFKNEFSAIRGISRKDLLKVDGATYYELVTGDKDALLKLYKVLPEVIRQVLNIPKATFKLKEEDFMMLFEKAYGKQD